MFKIDKFLSSTKSDFHVESTIGGSKVHISASCVLDEVIDLDASSLENT
jgi:hypothetical protein